MLCSYSSGFHTFSFQSVTSSCCYHSPTSLRIHPTFSTAMAANPGSGHCQLTVNLFFTLRIKFRLCNAVQKPLALRPLLNLSSPSEQSAAVIGHHAHSFSPSTDPSFFFFFWKQFLFKNLFYKKCWHEYIDKAFEMASLVGLLTSWIPALSCSWSPFLGMPNALTSI